MVAENVNRDLRLRGQTAIVCGGSKGIGKATAVCMAAMGANICIVAREQAVLDAAAAEILTACADAEQFVETISSDTTDEARLRPLLEVFVAAHGVPDYLVNMVGYAYPQYVQELALDDYRRNMEVNYYGQLVPIHILLPHFIAAGKGHIANVSSMMGYFGIMGYATYAPSKFAIVGLTEVLRHELKPYGITFSILYPPDVDTPGFERENQTKPPECAMMSENAKLMSPEAVAEVFVTGMLKRKFNILPGNAWLAWFLFRHFPGLLRWFLDSDYQKARRKLGKV
ncbi:MAG: SDR family oxidoreductase [Anaerolineales bacterium]|nr:SDR family oxidoreductase [Anaerolineales bacterium]